jgi:hypothetical protein
MNTLTQYLDVIVEPTLDEFRRHPTSLRHAYLACVAIYHAIDRVAYPQSRGNLRKEWRRESMEFSLIDIVAHDFKHVKSTDHQPVTDAIPIAHALYGTVDFNSAMFNDTGELETLRHLDFVAGDAVRFLRQKAESLAKQDGSKRGSPQSAVP